MADYVRRSRTTIWVVVIFALLFAFMGAWSAVEEEASNTAVIVASKRILERANYYRQQKILNGKSELNRAGNPLSYSPSGWLLPINDAARDCNVWLTQLYPEQRILGMGSPKVTDKSSKHGFYCEYQYTDKYQIDIYLVNGRFSVKANILAL